jgi:hypothetical protein
MTLALCQVAKDQPRCPKHEVVFRYGSSAVAARSGPADAAGRQWLAAV